MIAPVGVAEYLLCMSVDADVIVVGAGLAGLVAATKLAGAGLSSWTRSRRHRSAARLSGPSAGSSSSTHPNSGDWASATRASSRSRTGWAPQASTVKRTGGRAAGRRPMWTSRRARRAAGSAAWECGGFRWSDGPNGEAIFRTDRETRFRGSTSPGGPRRGCFVPSSNVRAGRRLRAPCGCGDRNHRRNRSEPRARPRNVAARFRRTAAKDAAGGPRPRRRTDARHRREGGRPPHQPGTDVALSGRHRELCPGLESPRNPYTERTVASLARCAGKAASGTALSWIRHPWRAPSHSVDRLRPLLVRSQPQDCKEGVCPLRF